MKKLIINPKKTSSNHDDENIFLQKCFLNYLSENYLQRINYSILSKKNFEIDHEIKQIKQNKEIYNEILIELFPILNKLNKVSWSYKTWNFFIGHWLYLYISIIRNRIDLVKPVINSGINYDEQIKIGKNTSLLCNDVRNFTFNCGLIEWNEKLFSRLLYIMHTRNFKNDANLLNSAKSFKKKNEKFLSKAIYILKINTIKFFARLICFKNNYLFYNSYINNKFKLLKIILELGDIPFMHSFSFFNNKIAKEEIDISLRKKIKLNIESKNSDIKILKFLLMELLPTIYLEGFQIQKKLADNSHLPKKIKKVFVSHAYPDNSFKFWLADKINSGTKLVHGQHGAGYNIYKDFFATFHELGISDFFFTWGWKNNNKKIVPVGNYLINKKKKAKLSYGKKILLVLPAATIFKRTGEIFYADSLTEDAIEYQKFLDNIDSNLLDNINIRNHPAVKRRDLDFINFVTFDKKKIKNQNSNISFDKSIINHGLVIFNYLSTEFFKLMSLDVPCILLLNKNIFNHCVDDKAKEDFYKLSKIGVFYTSGKDLAKQVNKISSNTKDWWNKENSSIVKKEFCTKHSNSNFDTKLFVNKLNKL